MSLSSITQLSLLLSYGHAPGLVLANAPWATAQSMDKAGQGTVDRSRTDKITRTEWESYLDGHKCPTLLLACFIYDCTHSCTVHSTVSEMNEEEFTEEESFE